MIRKPLVILLVVLLVSLSASLVAADAISNDERQELLRELRSTRQLLVDEVERLSPAQLNFKPNPFRWSIAEIVEHIMVAEERLMPMIMQNLATPSTGGNAPPAVQNPEVTVEKLLQVVNAREQRFQAPARVRPSGAAAEESLRRYLSMRDQVIEFVSATDRDLRTELLNNPLFGDIDGYRWFFFLSAHCSRHVKQIVEVKALSAFPE